MSSSNKQIVKIIGIGVILILVSNIIGHFAPPFSLCITPILLTVIIGGLNYPLFKENFYWTILYSVVLMLFNDLFLRLYAGGIHDQVGKALIMIFFTITSVLVFITVLVCSIAIIDKQSHAYKKTVFLQIFSLLIAAIITGLIYYYLIADI